MVKTFTIFYVLRACVVMTHGIYACTRINDIRAHDTKEWYVCLHDADQELLFIGQTIVSSCTVALSFVFFVLLSKNLEVVRQNFRTM